MTTPRRIVSSTDWLDAQENGRKQVHFVPARRGLSDLPNSRLMTPTLSHKLKHNKSILAIAVSGNSLYAGTEGGEILVGISLL